MPYIYIIENNLNGKLYIGKTNKKNPNDRWSQHKYAASKTCKMVVSKAIAKHGESNFSFNVFEYYDTAPEAELAEIFWIKHMRDSGQTLYNCTEGGDGNPGKRSEQAKANISAGVKAGKKRAPHSVATIAKIGLANKGKKRSSELKRKLSEAGKVLYANGYVNPMTGTTGNKCPSYGKPAYTNKVNGLDRKKIEEQIQAGMSKKEIALMNNICSETLRLFLKAGS